MALSRQQLHALAASGAAARIAELEAEIASIRSEFPGPRAAKRSRKPGRPARTRKRRKMSAAARKKISDAQKKRWAAKK